ncbi:VWA domain-containing protein [Pseudoalteromonas sp. MMG010]|uniref:vWA domain-containing protein n=1 Tax=Pseudoalteromonas sp. MMG010 TaxID=2822685 RepID=UPI001B3A7893|nr:VWA domain-containing protein [Pseudoalteromonas sp. MMG010]MBQ4831844.1 VWA domain-containing protein [Pseudoalteromonas sp. MMG010]
MDFVFIRPQVLWLLIVVLVLFILAYFKHKKTANNPLIAPHLAKFIVSGQSVKKQNPLWLLALFCTLAVIFSAGPSFEKKQVPVFQSKSARVIVMDMSYSMYSTDIQPNRLVQARFKTLDMINLFKEGDTALIAYAGSAFTISPLTNDAKTLENLIPSLSPEIMPDKGSNVLAGLDMAKELLSQAGYINGDIILITDGIDQQELDDVSQFTRQSSYTLNIYGIGTSQGAPIKLPEGGFLKDRYGQIVIPTINTSVLNRMAKDNGGRYASYQPSNDDIAVFAPSIHSEQVKDEKQSHALWRIDAGKYGILLLLPFALYLFRRHGFVAAFLLIGILPHHQAFALELPSLLKNTDQRALQAYKDKDYESASHAQSAQLKGAALYQNGNFDQALEQFKEDKSATGLYNYGNALAKSGQLEQALEAYKQAQQLQPDFSQAADNQSLVEQVLKQQQENQSSQDQQGDDDQKDQQQGDDNQQSQDQQGENGNESQDQQQQDQQNQDSEQSQQPSDDEQQSEDNSDNDDQQNQSQSQQSNSDKQNEPDMQTEQNQHSESDQPALDEQPQAEPQAHASEQPPTEQQKQDAQQQAMQAQASQLSDEEKEKAQQLNQLLRKVPDDPAILLRNKMQLEAQKRQYQRRPTGVEKSW